MEMCGARAKSGGREKGSERGRKREGRFGAGEVEVMGPKTKTEKDGPLSLTQRSPSRTCLTDVRK